MDTYIKMCEEAKGVQEALKDKFDYRRQGWCTYHKCRIEEDQMGVPICPGFMKKYHSAITREHPVLIDKEEGKFGFGSPEDCEYNKKWAGLPTQEQLQGMVFKVVNKKHLIFRFYDFLTNRYNEETHQNTFIVFSNRIGSDRDILITSLWLAFAEYEKFGKVWNFKSEKLEKKGGN